MKDFMLFGRQFICFPLLLVLAGFAFFACDTPLGMGQPVDTTAPIITILTPRDNDLLKGVARGEPVRLAGVYHDDMGIDSLKAVVTNVTTGQAYVPGKDEFVYSFGGDGAWKADLYLHGDGTAVYRIKVIAVDKFKNEGADEVSVRVDIIAPWVKRASVIRHTKIEKELNRVDFFEAFNFKGFDVYKELPFSEMDYFQNEAFSLRLEIDFNFDRVAAARLDVFNEDGEKINPEWLSPIEGRSLDSPEWRITASQLKEWNPAYGQGAHYIEFAAYAWDAASWDSQADGGKGGTVAGETYREQRLHGVCWYPETDYPRLRVNADVLGGVVSFMPNSPNALSIQVYDDDELPEIYAALVPKEALDTELEKLGITEKEYFESLKSDPDARNAAVAKWNLENLFSPVSSPDGREQIIRLSTGAAGEYRLIALAGDGIGGDLDRPASVQQWTVHTPLRVKVQDIGEPIIIIENPAVENIFPILKDGRKFSISGFTIDNSGVETIQIAWVAAQSGMAGKLAEVQTAMANAVISEGSSTTVDGVKIWKLKKGAREPVSINGVLFQRDNFSKEFDIVNDFQFNGKTENDNKLFVIHAVKRGKNIYQNFRLAGNFDKPLIEVSYPYRDFLIHDTEQALGLSMKVQSAIDLVPESIKISDVTAGNNDADRGMGNMAVNGNRYQRTVPVDFIKANFPDGSRISYKFEAADILGNEQRVERTIIMSNLPALVYITSSNAAGVYGIGDHLRFEAVFSLPVKVNKGRGSGPRLKLYFSDPGTGEPGGNNIETGGFGTYADYVESPSGNAVVFTYAVKDGQAAERLYISLNPVILPNGAAIEAAAAAGGNARLELMPGGGLQDKVQIKIDGERPKINGAGFSKPVSGQPYYNNGKTVTLELYASEQVRISGAPKAVISYGTNTTVEAAFSKVAHNAGKSTLFFTYTVDVGDDVPETQLKWAHPWLKLTSGGITDMAGNDIDLAPNSALKPDDLNGVNNGNKTAYILTRKPVPPTFALYKDIAGGGGNTPVNPFPAGNVYANKEIYLMPQGVPAANAFHYSLEAGNNGRELTGSYATIADADRINNIKMSYKPSEYMVTAWQTDRAGNRSDNSDLRSVTINSRAPELVDITCTEPNGSYSTGKELAFTLVFSRRVKVVSSGAKLVLKGTLNGFTDQTEEIPLKVSDNTAADTGIVFRWTVTAGLSMRNIKATSIVLDGIIDDEYGNALKDYKNTVKIETEVSRPLANDSAFNMKRDSDAKGSGGLIVDSVRPKIIDFTPSAPSTGELSNGGLMQKEPNTAGIQTGLVVDGKIVFKFDKAVWAQSGKNITVRPWDKWALPPILTVEEMDALFNSPLFGADETEYQRRLKWIDANGIPEVFSGAVNNDQLAAAFALRTKYNSYINTTGGLVSSADGNVRPDITPKWILSFDRDLYDNVDSLREVFNAAQWKWQIISAASGSVVINNDTVTITLPEPLQKGRIWEVLVDDGAFRDAAGNPSPEIVSTNAAGHGYRFWTKGTAEPVIRVDRYSHGDNYHGLPASYRGDWKTLPYIDTKVRIDCETPGAAIRYDTLRTKYTLSPGGSIDGNSAAFTSVSNTASGFFSDHPSLDLTVNKKPTSANYLYSNPGYGNNWIGNGGSHHNGTQTAPGTTDGYFSGLLVPVADETNSADIPVTQNGAVKFSAVINLGGALRGGNDLTGSGSLYRQIDKNGNASYGASVFNVANPAAPETAVGRFFYAGDAYTTGQGSETDRIAASNSDARLFTGRRDYITAAAQKNAVSAAGAAAGPRLDVSNASYEGVFKTTLIHREPGGGLYWLLIQGFDQPVTPSAPGFPLQEYVARPSINRRIEHTYFTKQAYRIGQTIGNTNVTTGAVNGVWPNTTWNAVNSRAGNNHIWVSWDIVCDWYLKGRNRGNHTVGEIGAAGRLQRDGKNYGAVLCTYGAVNYRFRQFFDDSAGVAGASNTNPNVTQ